MLLNHLVAVLFFSGPLLYIGLWMALDPADFARLPELIVRVLGKSCRAWVDRAASEEIAEQAAISRRLRTGLRFAGVVVVLFAIVV